MSAVRFKIIPSELPGAQFPRVDRVLPTELLFKRRPSAAAMIQAST
ncbi:hypothetical protein O9992_13235 [Vibrio lentus]|nr:hypothetical protein [Vibrio lentus]